MVISAYVSDAYLRPKTPAHSVGAHSSELGMLIVYPGPRAQLLLLRDRLCSTQDPLNRLHSVTGRCSSMPLAYHSSLMSVGSRRESDMMLPLHLDDMPEPLSLPGLPEGQVPLIKTCLISSVPSQRNLYSALSVSL